MLYCAMERSRGGIVLVISIARQRRNLSDSTESLSIRLFLFASLIMDNTKSYERILVNFTEGSDMTVRFGSRSIVLRIFSWFHDFFIIR